MTPPAPPEHMGTTTFTSAAELTLGDLAELFTRAYHGYAVEMHVDAGAMAFMEETFDLSVAHSHIAWRDGRSVGVAMLGLRGDRGWVGGMGVVPEARRSGLGEQLMTRLIGSARTAGVRRLGLEVLQGNDGARLLYEKLGFRPTRRLEVLVWDGVPSARAGTARACAPREARQRIVAARGAKPPWQRADESLDRLDVSTPALRALSTPGGDAVYRVTDGRASVLQMHATSETSAGVLLDTIRTREGVQSVRFLNVPDDDLATAALHARGAVCLVSQSEMVLEL
ncbi:MAG: GNAT family N-acetyltransferase [Candidatus Eisenbacteria bacterium]